LRGSLGELKKKNSGGAGGTGQTHEKKKRPCARQQPTKKTKKPNGTYPGGRVSRGGGVNKINQENE